MLTLTLSAQDMVMYSNTVWSGIQSSQINPSYTVTSPLYLDINFASFNLSAENNYLYIYASENKLSRIFKSTGYQNEGSIKNDNKFYADYYTPGNKSGYINLRVSGPGFNLVLGKHSFGIQTQVRSITSVEDIPIPLAKFMYEGLYWPEQHNIRYKHSNKMSIANLSWGEIGINYSTIFSVKNKRVISAGITLKKLTGYGGAKFYSDNIDYMMQGSDTMIIYNIDAEGGYSLPVDYTNNSFIKDYSRGSGYGVDVGISIERKKRSPGWIDRYSRPCSQYYVPYDFRLGLSLIDIGSITFSENAKSFKVEDGSLYWPGIKDIKGATFAQMEDSISTHLFNDPNQLYTDNRLRMALPATLSIQADYNLHNDWYVSGVAIIPISDKRSAVRASELISGFRYENRYFALGINASLYNWEKIHLGIMGRIGSFFIGSDNLLSFMRVDDYTGSDFYAGLKISLNKGRCIPHNQSCPGLSW